MANYETILTEKSGPAFIVTLNRPDRRNAFSRQLMREMVDALRDAEADAEVRGVIVSGGPDYFSAGADLVEARAVGGSKENVDQIENWKLLNRTVENLRKPVLAAIEGFCITGGWEFAMACDIRVAAKGSTYAITSSRIGTVAGAGGTQRLPRQVGIGKALDILFSCDTVDAEEAYRIGAVERLVEKGQALAECKKMVDIYAERAPLSLAYVKRAVRGGIQMDLESAVEFEQFISSVTYGTEDRLEGIGAFLEKRKATFKGK